MDQHISRDHADETPMSRDTVDNMVEEEVREREGSDRIPGVVSYQLILDNIRKKDFEIVVLVEGIESVTSSKLQARYSYAASDIITNCAFMPCVSIGKDGEAVIDFCKFHETVPIESNNSEQDILFMQSII